MLKLQNVDGDALVSSRKEGETAGTSVPWDHSISLKKESEKLYLCRLPVLDPQGN